MNNNFTLKKSFALLTLVLIFSGCYYDKFEEISPSDQVSFSSDIQPIFDTHCTSCHPVLVSSPDLSPGNSYNSINNGIYVLPNDYTASLLYQRLLGNPTIMPPGGSLSATEINLVKSWIQQGALNN